MFYLNVPYNEKERANDLGASWDSMAKKWFVPEEVDLENFKEWIPIESLEEAKNIIEGQKPEKGLKLSTLLVKVKNIVESNVAGTYWINSEIANIQLHKGSLYLLLAETDKKGKEVCTNRAIIWADNVEGIQHKFKSETGNDLIKGLKVLLKVKVTYSLKFQLSLNIVDIDPSFTLGGIESKIKKIRDRVVALDLYDKNKKYKQPFYFRNVAVVSPNEAAGLGDFKADADLLEKNKICKFTYYTAVFQGNTASKTVSDAIKKASFDSLKKKFDVIVVIRGGGAKTDLHFLNEFDIAKEVANSKVPVFIGVGHERDKVLIDEIAFRSFDTPSKVIGYISTNNISKYTRLQELDTEIKHLVGNLQKNIKDKIKTSVNIINANANALKIGYKSNIGLKHNEIFLNATALNKYYQNNVSAKVNEINDFSLKVKSSYKIKLEDSFSKIKISSNTLKTNYVMKLEDKHSAIKMSYNIKIKNLQSDLHLKYNSILNSSNITISEYKVKLNKVSTEIEISSPLNALDNGFAIIKTKKGSIVKSIEDIKNENSFIIWMKDGEKEFTNEEYKNDWIWKQ